MWDLATDAMVLATISTVLCCGGVLVALVVAGAQYRLRRHVLQLADRQHKLLCDVASTAGQVRVLVSEMDATRATQRQLLDRLTEWSGKACEYAATSHDLSRTFRDGLRRIDQQLDGIVDEVGALGMRLDAMEQDARIIRDKPLLQPAFDQLRTPAFLDLGSISFGPGEATGISATDDLQLGDAA